MDVLDIKKWLINALERRVEEYKKYNENFRYWDSFLGDFISEKERKKRIAKLQKRLRELKNE